MNNIQPANEFEFTHSNQFAPLSNHDADVNNTSTKENSSVNQGFLNLHLFISTMF